jgi:hypothetical protein
MGLKYVRIGGDWIHWAQDMEKKRVLVNTVINFIFL